MNRLTKWIFSVSVGIMAEGCYYDTQDVLYSARLPIPCDTTNITYLKSIAPIINVNCNGCHSTVQSPTRGGGIILDSYRDLRQQAIGGNLMNDINQVADYDPMPKTGKLSDCDIAFIQRWVNMNMPIN